MLEPDEGFWSPNPIDLIRAFLRKGIPDDDVLAHNRAFISNIAYNLQYLEFLNHLLTDKQLHVTVRTQSQKSFVIGCMSIIEAILWYVLRKNRMHKIEEWEEIKEFQTPSFRNGDDEFCIKNTILKKRNEPIEREMTLDSMIKKVESKKLLGIEHQVYRDLNYLRKLRNRVHIHAVQHDRDTDWYSFNDQEVKLSKKVLFSVLSSDFFEPEEKHCTIIQYMKVQEPIDQLADSIPF